MGMADAVQAASRAILDKALGRSDAPVYRRYDYVAICWGCGEEIAGAAISRPVAVGDRDAKALEEANEANFREMIADAGWRSHRGCVVCPSCAARIDEGDPPELRDPMGGGFPHRGESDWFDDAKKELLVMYANSGKEADSSGRS